MNMDTDANDTKTEELEDLICFVLYSANNAMNRSYKPHLSKIGLTYPQYITLTALWKNDGTTVGELCKKLMIETSTLTPLLKRLEQLGHVVRKRNKSDERQVMVHLTESGKRLQQEAPSITRCIVEDTGVAKQDLPDLVASIAALRQSLIHRRQTRS